jgi:hypothetical protein
VKVIVGAAAVLALGFVGSQRLLPPNPTAVCLAKVEKFQAVYTSDRPESESGPSDLSRVAQMAENACREGRLEFAQNLLGRSMMMCRLNNGCGEKSRPKIKTSS